MGRLPGRHDLLLSKINHGDAAVVRQIDEGTRPGALDLKTFRMNRKLDASNHRATCGLDDRQGTSPEANDDFPALAVDAHVVGIVAQLHHIQLLQARTIEKPQRSIASTCDDK